MEPTSRATHVNHLLIYKNYDDGCDFHVIMPKTEAGIRKFAMSKMVVKAFETTRRHQPSSNCRQSPHVKVWAFSCFWHFHNV